LTANLTEDTKPIPKGWGDDSLTLFFENARQNQFATYANKAAAKDLILVERILRSLVADAVDPTPYFPFQFMLRGHAILLAAAATALAGQNYESSALQRASLECAAYGVFIGDSDARAKLWLSRHDSKQAHDNVRNAFGFAKVHRDVAAKDAELGRTLQLLYDTSIDFGAHPNERAFSTNMAVRSGPDGSELLDTIYLHEDGPQLDFALKGTIQQGIWNVIAFRLLYPGIYAAKNVANDVQGLMSRY
jgi:hypothetical protein